MVFNCYIVEACIVGTPIHEFGHLACLWCLGNRKPKKVLWLSFREDPYVEYERGCYRD